MNKAGNKGIRIVGLKSQEERPHVSDEWPAHVTGRKLIAFFAHFVVVKPPINPPEKPQENEEKNGYRKDQTKTHDDVIEKVE